MPVNPESRNDSGIIIILTSMVMLAVITLTVLAVNTNYAADVRAQLQAAADATAFAGASQLNSSQSGWDAARSLSVHTLGEHNALSSVGSDISLKVNPSASGDTWNHAGQRNLIVEIQRGSWRNGQFTSMENDWEQRNPGLPRVILANAVRVRLTRPNTRILRAPIKNAIESYKLEGEAVALRGPIDPVCAAPFALPVCSVVGQRGDFMGSDVCTGDRVFAPVERYCRPGDPSYPNCRYLPSAAYTGCPSAGRSSSGLDPSALASCKHVHGQQGSCKSWGWNDRSYYTNLGDHYGVFGLPGFNPERNLEEEVLGVFRDATNTDKCVPTSIGDSYQILEGGLRTPEADGMIWDMIRNFGSPANDNTPNHLPFIQSGLGSLQANSEVYRILDAQAYQSCGVDRTWNGICNSHRGRYETSGSGRSRSSSFRLYGSQETDPEVVTDETTVWRIKVPIIAEPGNTAGACQGGRSNVDPLLSASKGYLVVGFADVLVYDVDIGHAPPAGLAAADMAFREPCNNVRARISCDTKFIPSSASAGFDRPRLVF